MLTESKLIDYTRLSPDTTTKQVEALCTEAKKYDFCSVCISPCQVKTAAKCLQNSDVKVCTVIGFPSGTHVTCIKAAETKQAVQDGAQEVDMVINVGAAKEGNWEYVKNDIAAVVEAAGKDVLVKVILETCLLTDEEIVEACKCAQLAGADFVKTSTGFSKAGATTEAVALMRKTVGNTMGVKAAGGIRTPETFKAMVAAGANRIGTSAGIKLLGGVK